MSQPGLCDHRHLLSESIHPLGSRIIAVPLNDDEKLSWLNFDDSQKWRRQSASYGIDSIDVNHPFVPVVTSFAVAAFNQLSQMYVKEDDEENIYLHEVTQVEFFPNSHGYVFYIMLEALEENLAGVYQAAVFCHCDGGRRTLINFIHSTSVPVCTKVTWMAKLISQIFFYEVAKERKKIIKGKLMKLRCNTNKGKKCIRLRAECECIHLRAKYQAAKAVCMVAERRAHLVKPYVYKIKHSDTDHWYVPAKITGLQSRFKNLQQGYDYHNPMTVFSGCLEDKLISKRRFERDRSQDWS